MFWCPPRPGELDPPLAGHSIGLLNRGTPSSLVTPDGTLHIALMRSCSGWPSGVWIDGEKRAAPDGSSFAWQHWSHTFEYALAAGAGDWRDAGLVLLLGLGIIPVTARVEAGLVPFAEMVDEDRFRVVGVLRLSAFTALGPPLP